MKYIVVGTSHFGYEAVQTILKQEADAEIHLYERGGSASFMGWGSQSYVEGTSQSLDELHFANEASYREQGINIHCNSDVVAIQTDEKTITVQDADGEHTVSYDKLLLSPGGYAVKPPIEGIDLENINTFRGPEDTAAVKEQMAGCQSAVIIGGGYIGIEVAEAYAQVGIPVTVIDMQDRLLATSLDKEFTDVLEAASQTNGLNFRPAETVKAFEGQDGKVKAVVTDQATYPADTVILAAGVKADDQWLRGSLEMDERGFIVTNEYLETSAPDVYAGGDSTCVPFAPTHQQVNISLATIARRQGIVAALNAMGQKVKMPELTGTSALSLFGYNFVSTGLKAASADQYQGQVASCYVEEPLYPDFMRKEGKIAMKIYYDADDHRILGGQLMSKKDITDGITGLSIAIASGWTLEDLALADIHFMPRFDRPWHYLNVLAMAALDYKIGGADKLLF